MQPLWNFSVFSGSTLTRSAKFIKYLLCVEHPHLPKNTSASWYRPRNKERETYEVPSVLKPLVGARPPPWSWVVVHPGGNWGETVLMEGSSQVQYREHSPLQQTAMCVEIFKNWPHTFSAFPATAHWPLLGLFSMIQDHQEDPLSWHWLEPSKPWGLIQLGTCCPVHLPICPLTCFPQEPGGLGGTQTKTF